MEFAHLLDGVAHDNLGKYHDGYDAPTGHVKEPHYPFGASSLQSCQSKDFIRSRVNQGYPYVTDDHVCLLQLFGEDEGNGYQMYDQ